MALDEEILADLQAGLDQIDAKQTYIDLYWAYYEGKQSPVWLTESIREKFGNALADSFSLNFCKLAVNTVLNRLAIEGWEDEGVKKRFYELRLDREQSRINKHAIIAGESYVVAWEAGADAVANKITAPGGIIAAFNDARYVHLFYEVENPHVKQYAIKTWLDNGVAHANLYYSDRVERFSTDPTKKLDQIPVQASEYDWDSEDQGGPHTFGEVPVWHFAENPHEPRSYLEDLAPIQDKINKLSSNKMVAAEFAAWKQRVFLTTQNLNRSQVENDPGSALVLDPGGDDGAAPTRVTEFDATPLENYDNSIVKEISHFFTIASLPKNMLISPGADSSGDAIRSDQGNFAELVQTLTRNLGYAYTDLMFTMTDKWDKPIWKDTIVNNAEARARIFKMLVDSGVPPRVAAIRILGWTKDQAAELPEKTPAQEANEARENQINQGDAGALANPDAPIRTQTTEDNPS